MVLRKDQYPATPAYFIDTILFRDLDRIWYPVDETGFNKVGYVTRRDSVIHPRLNRGLTETPLPRIRRHAHNVWRCTANTQIEVDNVERFFTENQRSIELFEDGMTAILRAKLSFFENPIRIPILDVITSEEFERRWAMLRSLLRPADLVFVINSKNIISRLIARFDHGPWSHVGSYSGDGTILEAIPGSVVERNIEVYHTTDYRLGVYRTNTFDNDRAEQYVGFLRSQLGCRYSYRKAIRLAAFKLFGIRPTGKGFRNTSPNDMARWESIRLIHVV